MSEKTFKASNSYQVATNDMGRMNVWVGDGVGTSIFYPNEVTALREYFQHERDVELGRARWPENPDYVIYRDPAMDSVYGDKCVRVLDETTGTYYRYRSSIVGAPESAALHETVYAARWWFENNPAPKPWQEANLGEVWRLTVDGQEMNAVAELSGGRIWFCWPNVAALADDEKITAGRKLLNADGTPADG